MLKYLLIFIIIFILYSIRNKIIEPLGPLGIRDDSPKEDNNEGDINIYITNNQIDYNALDKDIEHILRQEQLLDRNMKNMKFNIGYVDNNLFQHKEPTFTVGGSYPNDIKFNFAFPPPMPGVAGIRGDKGSKGPIGPKGQSGPRGSLGGNNYC